MAAQCTLLNSLQFRVSLPADVGVGTLQREPKVLSGRRLFAFRRKQSRGTQVGQAKLRTQSDGFQELPQSLLRISFSRQKRNLTLGFVKLIQTG